jgi:hypothetical protein
MGIWATWEYKPGENSDEIGNPQQKRLQNGWKIQTRLKYSRSGNVGEVLELRKRDHKDQVKMQARWKSSLDKNPRQVEIHTAWESKSDGNPHQMGFHAKWESIRTRNSDQVQIPTRPYTHIMWESSPGENLAVSRIQAKREW